MKHKKIQILLISIAIVLLPVFAFAQSMTSTNYKVIGSAFSPGDYGTSTNYAIIDTAGDWETSATSTNYKEYGGFIGLIYGGSSSLTANISGSSVNLGELSAESVSSGSVILTVTTDASLGYSTYIYENQNLSSGSLDINDVSDGAITAGSEEYGIRTSGTAGQYNSADTSISTNYKTIAASTSSVSSQETNVSFKASISSNTSEGTYSHTITIATVINF